MTVARHPSGQAPAISVIMPVRDRARTVGRAVESVLAQDFAGFELIAVDDGSSDGTAETIEAFGDPRIRVLRLPAGRGANAARNRGIVAAAAPLISFLDSDDAFMAHKLAYVAAFFARRPEADALIDSFSLIYPAARAKPEIAFVNPVHDGGPDVERALFAREIFKATPAISLRTSAAFGVGLFDETLTRRQDFDFALRLARTGRLATTDAVLWTKSWSPDAISAKQSTFMDATVALCARHPRYAADPAFRPGLARDMARHFLKLSAKGLAATALRDARKGAAAFGAGPLAGRVASGLVEIARRGTLRSGVALREGRAAGPGRG